MGWLLVRCYPGWVLHTDWHTGVGAFTGVMLVWSPWIRVTLSKNNRGNSFGTCESGFVVSFNVLVGR